MLRVVSAVVLWGLFGLVACSGKYVDQDDEDTTKPPTKSPPQLCREYANAWCTKFFTCYVKVGRMQESEKQKNITACYDDLNERLPCAEVSSISDDFDTCVSQVNGLSCTKFDLPRTQLQSIQAPASCDGVMSFD
jgi:hypothetical protein